ncbi:MAG: PhoH family protein [Nitrospinota bacterium]
MALEQKGETALLSPAHLGELFGVHDQALKSFERAFQVRLEVVEDGVRLHGAPGALRQAREFLNELERCLREGYGFDQEELVALARLCSSGETASIREMLEARITVAGKRRYILPKSPTQRAYVRAIDNYDIVVGIGPAGTGKTYLAMAMAVSFFLRKAVSRILLVRPAVEAGEKLGFLPGDLLEKVNPYLRPLYDALYDMLDYDKARRFMERGAIEVAPLAYMRGRTLNDSFVILDEAQNATPEQMKMFLTRLGFGTRTVVTGDITQVDLPDPTRSGLIHAARTLRDIQGIRFVFFSERDVVRHPLVREVIRAYEAQGS